MTRDQDQTVVEHLTEFRHRFVSVCVCFALVFVASFFFAPQVYAFLTSGFDQKLIVLGPDDILWIYVQLSSIMAFTVSLPFMVYQIWAYVRPALEETSSRLVGIYILAIFLCFIGGLAFGFVFVTPNLLRVLLSLGQGLFETQLTARNYLNFVLHTSLPLALIFEMPVLVAFLTSLSILSPTFLVNYRRYAYFILLVLAVVLTPADFISDLAMTLPLIGIYEISLLVSRIISRKKK
ncbi:twin-arginine translocase subunit TatC [Streptococcus caprae]|uniref:Sec-independent protein translocase protein TatC n=1 Tax=Streptococcus caprae TaxID=1640501 RepID=A0ABV8CXX6_9STRE